MSTPKASLSQTLLVGIAVGVLAAGVQAQTFTRIVDTNTNIPGSQSTFDGLGDAAIEGDIVGFSGSSDTPPNCIVGVGIYRYYNGSISIAADGCTEIPECPCGLQYVGFNQPAVGSNLVSFTGAAEYDGCYCRGIYTRINNAAPTIVADWTTIDPGGYGYLSEFFNVSRSGQTLSFSAFTSSYMHGIYRAVDPNSIDLVANYDTSIPGGNGDFSAFGFNPTIGSGLVVFTGGTENHSQWGVYLANVGIWKVADLSTPVPGSQGSFVDFSDSPSTEYGSVVFHALVDNNLNNPQPGVYTTLGGRLRVVADTGTSIPSGTGTFTNFKSFNGVSMDGERIVFLGYGANGQQGIYLDKGGQLYKIVDLSTALEIGKTLVSLDIQEQCIDGTRVVFTAMFTTGTPGENYYGIYIAQLPNGW